MTNTPQGRIGGKVALITGAASGIGRATALLFAHEGASVAVSDHDEEGACSAVEEIQDTGGHAMACRLDVTSEDDWTAAIERVLNAWGKLDILVNNAGIAAGTPIDQMPLEEWRRVMTINADGVFLGTKHAIRAMRQGRGGSIVNLSSASGLKAAPGAAAYCVSKAAVRMISRVAALECAQQGDGIRVNTVLPGGTATPMWQSTDFWAELADASGGEAGAWAALSQDVPLKRFAQPMEIAQAILYLASDEARFVTGAELVIDGGYTA
jgi:NAD(P)-dependent dehydrogenase (short-subunit alcohol dehydrogenase family)